MWQYLFLINYKEFQAPQQLLVPTAMHSGKVLYFEVKAGISTI